jgi:hypothetical protein
MNALWREAQGQEVTRRVFIERHLGGVDPGLHDIGSIFKRLHRLVLPELFACVAAIEPGFFYAPPIGDEAPHVHVFGHEVAAREVPQPLWLSERIERIVSRGLTTRAETPTSD